MRHFLISRLLYILAFIEAIYKYKDITLLPLKNKYIIYKIDNNTLLLQFSKIGAPTVVKTILNFF